MELSDVKVGMQVKVVQIVEPCDDYEIGDVYTVEEIDNSVIVVDDEIVLYAEEIEPVEAPIAAGDVDCDDDAYIAGMEAKVKADGDIPQNSMAIQEITDTAIVFAPKGVEVRSPLTTQEIILGDMSIRRDLENRGWTLTKTPEIANDNVHQPAHYANHGIEPIHYMADKLPAYDDGFTAFCAGNVLKYVSRAPHKHDNPIEDLRKAMKYLEFAIEHEEKKQK